MKVERAIVEQLELLVRVEVEARLEARVSKLRERVIQLTRKKEKLRAQTHPGLAFVETRLEEAELALGLLTE